MKVYQIDLVVKSPLIITGTKSGRVISHSIDYLPGQTVRGALLTLFKFLGSSTVSDEIEKPSMFFHPAYPYINGHLAFPADPLTFKCKVCGKIFQQELPDEIDKLEFPYKCINGHMYTVKSIGGSLVIRNGDKLRNVKLNYVASDSVGMNRILRSSEVGLLYTYVALAPETKFRGMVVDTNDRLEKMFGEAGLKMNDFELRIGRRKSAGFGLVRASITEIKNYIEKRVRQIEQMDGKICLLAKSPIFNLYYEQDGSGKYRIVSTLLREVRGIKIKGVMKTSGVRVSGYSLKSNLPKPAIPALNIGTLMIVDGEVEKLVEAELFGIGPFSISGLNIVEVIGR